MKSKCPIFLSAKCEENVPKQIARAMELCKMEKMRGVFFVLLLLGRMVGELAFDSTM